MKQYDKNSVTAFILMALILIIFNTFFFPEVNQETQEKSSKNEAYNDTKSTKIKDEPST